MMSFGGYLYLSLAIFCIGLFYKASCWFRYTLREKTAEMSVTNRIYAAVKGIALTLLSGKIAVLFSVFLFDVLLQAKTFKVNRYRWCMHLCLFVGFTGLLLMHALGRFTMDLLFSDYYPTLNPFLFFRNLFAFLVILGLALAGYRRFFAKQPRLTTRPVDTHAIILLAVIMVSGILLEGAKIASYTRYQDMVADYSDLDALESLALESYWVNDFGVASPALKGPFGEDVLALGRELHETNCASCHSSHRWAFLSYPTAKAVKPIAAKLDRFGFPLLLWYIHFLSCFIGLAYLPFSKMFHVFTGPLSLMTNAVMRRETSDPANMATKQILELDACTHCGACTLNCAVGISFEEIHNIYILPSEKIPAVRALAADKKLDEKELRTIQRGLVLCTNCYRCTGVCPVGINLQDLWFDAREALLQKEYPEFFMFSPLSLYRANKQEEMLLDRYQKPVNRTRQAIAEASGPELEPGTPVGHTRLDGGFKRLLALSVQGHTASSCFTCKTCTLACPVVRNYDNPRETLGMMPHQIIHAANVGLADLAFSSRMLWSCLGCYECQEHCPQGVEVADVLYELKMLAIDRFSKG